MKRLIISKYIEKAPISTLLHWTNFPRSSWYYKQKNGKQGIPLSTHTFKIDGSVVKNEDVIDEIKQIFTSGLDFYGYEKTTWELQDLDYIINKKKVYRLMKEANLLLIRDKIVKQGKRRFVQFRCIEATRPLEYLTMDIKYVMIHEEKRYVYLLTILDVYSRFAVGFTLKRSIKKTDVVLLLDGVLQGISAKGIVIRTDNGSQFLAYIVRDYLAKIGVIQEFTHIATPEENSYIESHFSVLEREVLNRNWFESIYHARMKLEDYYKIYNFRRKQRFLDKKSPYQFIKNNFPDMAEHPPFNGPVTFGNHALEAIISEEKQYFEHNKKKLQQSI